MNWKLIFTISTLLIVEGRILSYVYPDELGYVWYLIEITKYLMIGYVIVNYARRNYFWHGFLIAEMAYFLDTLARLIFEMDLSGAGSMISPYFLLPISLFTFLPWSMALGLVCFVFSLTIKRGSDPNEEE